MKVVQLEKETNIFTVDEKNGEMDVWLDENMGWDGERCRRLMEQGYWLPPEYRHFEWNGGEIIWFRDDTDAMAFKLRWM
jgi:hypothetical protein